MQVSIDQLFSQIGRLQVEKTSLERVNATLAQEVLKLREKVISLEKGGGKDTKPANVTEFPKCPQETDKEKKPE
jgi:hypothetical protein